jgi:hypothetical protein
MLLPALSSIVPMYQVYIKGVRVATANHNPFAKRGESEG